MKKLLYIFAMILFVAQMQTVKAITFEEAMNATEPVAILIYADWADDIDKVMQSSRALEQKYGQKYNFVYMNIASAETKEFNKKFHIYPNLPYMLLFKDRGKVSRYLQKSCILDNSCSSQRFDFFTN